MRYGNPFGRGEYAMRPVPVDALPNLVIAGVTKAGTTSLHHYLTQHPDICGADVKEVDHYAGMVDGVEPPGLEQYAAHYQGCRGAAWRLDASPRYFLGGALLVRRLLSDLGSPRVIIALREPTARMWSSYSYKRSKGRLPDDMDFLGFFEECRRVYEQGRLRERDAEAFRTLGTGVYVDILAEWFDVLGDDLRIVFFEDLAAAPADQTATLCRWLGLDEEPVGGFDFGTRNRTVQPRSQALRRAAYGFNARAGRWLGQGTGAGRALRRIYGRLNSGSLDERLTDEQRERVASFYAPHTARLVHLLDARGVGDRPAWCRTATPVGQGGR